MQVMYLYAVYSVVNVLEHLVLSPNVQKQRFFVYAFEKIFIFFEKAQISSLCTNKKSGIQKNVLYSAEKHFFNLII